MSYRIKQRRFQALAALNGFGFARPIKCFAEFVVEPPVFDFACFGFFGTSLRSCRELADGDRGDEKSSERYSILGIGDRQRVIRRQKKEIEAEHRQHGPNQRRFTAECNRDEQDSQ